MSLKIQSVKISQIFQNYAIIQFLFLYFDKKNLYDLRND